MEKHNSIDADSGGRFSGDRGDWQDEHRRKSPGHCGSQSLQREKPWKRVCVMSLLDNLLGVAAFAWVISENIPTRQTKRVLSFSSASSWLNQGSGSRGAPLDGISRRCESQVSRLRVQRTLLWPVLVPWVGSPALCWALWAGLWDRDRGWHCSGEPDSEAP